MKKKLQKLLALALAAVLLVGLGPQALAADRLPVRALTLGTDPSDMLAAGGSRVRAGDLTYYVDDANSCVYEAGIPAAPVLEGPAAKLNYADGVLYFARPRTGTFDLCAYDLRTGLETLLLAEVAGTPGQVWLVNGQTLDFSVGDTVWELDLAQGGLRILLRAEGLWSFVPTAQGLLWATGSLFDLRLYAEGRLVADHVEDYTLRTEFENGLLVFSQGSGDLQLDLTAAFTGSAAPAAFTGLPADPEEDRRSPADPAVLWQDPAGGETRTQGDLTAVFSEDAPRRSLSSGVVNIVKRCRQMLNIQWTPVKGVGGWGYYDSGYDLRIYYNPGVTYTGLPYGQPVGGWGGYVGSYVPWNTSLSGFIDAVNDPNSRMYTARSNYSRGSQYYGTDCSGFASWSWQTASRMICTGMKGVSTRIGTSYTSIQVGDALISSYHVVVVTDVTYNQNGSIASIELSQANPTKTYTGCAYSTRYTGTSALESMARAYFTNGGYAIYRSDTRDSVTYTHSCAVPLEGDVCSICGYGTGPVGPPDQNSGTTVPIGIDVSGNNGVIDWAEVSKEIDFAIIRVGYTGNTVGQIYKDSQADANIQGCIDNNIPYGIYYYAGATTPEKAGEEALAVLRFSGILDGNNAFHTDRIPTLPIFYDVEERNNIMTLPNGELLSVITGFCGMLEEIGIQTGVYASASVWNSRLQGQVYDNWTHWVAFWDTQNLTVGAGANVWQYNNEGSVDGVNGHVDMNYWIAGDPPNREHPSTVSIVPPTCGVEGRMTCTCVRCGEVRQRSIRCQSHFPGETRIENLVPATCTAPGVYDEVEICSLCGEEAGRNPVTLEPLGHDLDETLEETLPTCTEPGSRTSHCARCDLNVTEELPALGHDYVQGWCARCGAKQPIEERFTDVRLGQWYTEAVEFVADNGLFSGVSADTFGLRLTMDRAMMVTVLYSLAGKPEVEGENPFEDVGETAYYRTPVIWAAAGGIVSGTGEHTFSPKSQVTREQVAIMLHQYLRTLDPETPAPETDLSEYPDLEDVHDYAMTALSWAVENGVISGSAVNGETLLLPRSSATRAQVAVMLRKFALLLQEQGLWGDQPEPAPEPTPEE